jgi:large subunit ribosomal protein L25
MEQLQLRAEKGRSTGSRPARRLRREGMVPAVVYGRDLETLSVAVNGRDLSAVLATEAGLNALINLDCEGDEVLTVAREIQRHPVRGEIVHLDFVKISLTERIRADVTIDFVGEPYGVTQEGGIFETIRNTVLIEALPTEIPSSLTVDVSELDIGDTLQISDLTGVEGVEIVDDGDLAIATILAPRIIEEEVPEELEGEELFEVEEGEGAPAAEAGEGEAAADEQG